jgi:hypothetical protein
MKSIALLIVTLVIAAAGGFVYFSQQEEVYEDPAISQEVSEALPEQIPDENKVNELEPTQETEVDATSATHPEIRVTTPQPGETVSSPLTITGEARGTWFFEGSFPVSLTDLSGQIIGEGIATTTAAEWMTEEFIPFEAELEFEEPTASNEGILILRKNNPSDMRQLDDEYGVRVFLSEIGN